MPIKFNLSALCFISWLLSFNTNPRLHSGRNAGQNYIKDKMAQRNTHRKCCDHQVGDIGMRFLICQYEKLDYSNFHQIKDNILDQNSFILTVVSDTDCTC